MKYIRKIKTDDGKEHEVYITHKVNKPVSGTVVVPGSKSMTNRAL